MSGFFCFNDPATTEIYTYLHTLSLHDALPIFAGACAGLREDLRTSVAKHLQVTLPHRQRTGQRQPQVGSMATHADRAVAPWLQAAGREYPIALGGLELESSRQRQVQGQPSRRHLQSRAASA